jgi:hypothetical protein
MRGEAFVDRVVELADRVVLGGDAHQPVRAVAARVLLARLEAGAVLERRCRAGARGR